MRVSQVEIEPVLQGVVKELPAVEARWDVAFEELTQDAEGVTATLRAADGSEEQLRCHYLVGCDGGSSEVRNCLGIRLHGKPRVMDRLLVHFRSTSHDVLQHFGVAWHYQSPKGTLIAQNDRDSGHSRRGFRRTSRRRRLMPAQCFVTSPVASSITKSCSQVPGRRIFWSPSATASTGHFSPATPRTSTSQPAATA